MFASEEKFLLSSVARANPNTRSVHPRTIVRWAVRGSSGVILESVLVGSRRMTSHQALQRFLERLNGLKDNGNAPEKGPRSPSARAKASEDAAAALAAIGA